MGDLTKYTTDTDKKPKDLGVGKDDGSLKMVEISPYSALDIAHFNKCRYLTIYFAMDNSLWYKVRNKQQISFAKIPGPLVRTACESYVLKMKLNVEI